MHATLPRSVLSVDTVLGADNENELQEMLDILVRESEENAYLRIKIEPR